MSFTAKVAVRTRLKANQALADWSIEHFNQPPTFYIGLKRASSAKADELPIVSIVTARTRIGSRDESAGLSIVIGLKEAAVEDGVYIGSQLKDEMIALIARALKPYELETPEPLNIYIDPGFAGFGDLDSQHPFYESELQIIVNIQPQI